MGGKVNKRTGLLIWYYNKRMVWAVVKVYSKLTGLLIWCFMMCKMTRAQFCITMIQDS